MTNWCWNVLCLEAGSIETMQGTYLWNKIRDAGDNPDKRTHTNITRPTPGACVTNQCDGCPASGWIRDLDFLEIVSVKNGWPQDAKGKHLITMGALSICGHGKCYDEVTVDIRFSTSPEPNIKIRCLRGMLWAIYDQGDEVFTWPPKEALVRRVLCEPWAGTTPPRVGRAKRTKLPRAQIRLEREIMIARVEVERAIEVGRLERLWDGNRGSIEAY